MGGAHFIAHLLGVGTHILVHSPPMGKGVFDAGPEPPVDSCDDIFPQGAARHDATERDGMTGFPLPPFTKVDEPGQAILPIGETGFVDDYAGIYGKAGDYRIAKGY